MNVYFVSIKSNKNIAGENKKQQKKIIIINNLDY
jgi:hypothetical protein